MEEAKQQRQIWTEEDNQLLNEGVNIYGLKWQQVANYMKTRTPSQCAQRWKRIKQKITKQKKKSVSWTIDESNKLQKYVRSYGQNWQLIAEMFGNKTNRQVRDKYLNSLDPKIQQKSWTQEEDDILYENFLLYGNKWTQIKTKLPYRSERMIKNRFYNHIRYSHLKLQNPYKQINNQINPQEEIQQHRLQAIESQWSILQESLEQTDQIVDVNLDEYLNLGDDFYNFFKYDN